MERWFGIRRMLALALLASVTNLSRSAGAANFAIQVLHVFDSPGPSHPASGVLRKLDGSLYGVTPEGNALEGGNGSGTVYRIAPGGQIDVLKVFDGSIGYYPTSGLVEALDGNLYGAPYTAGPAGAFISFFRVAQTGEVTNVLALPGGTNGYIPNSMLLGEDGDLYGTTKYGGAGYSETNGASNGGSVFRLTPAGEFTLLYSFIGMNGFQPLGRLVQASNGRFYGTTVNGGVFGLGTVFSISTSGAFQLVLSFDGTNGAGPVTGLVEGDDGWLYGMTEGDINSQGRGTIYKISTNGEIATIATFIGANGRYPRGSLVKGDAGEFYGVAQLGGTFDGGTAFKVTTNGVISVIVSFDDTSGRWPTELTKGSDGNFYGTASVLGGPFGNGTVFRLAQIPEIYSISVTNSTVQLTWTAFTGGVYQVLCKSSISETNWSALSGRITANGNSASFADNLSKVPSFYRINLLPW